MPTITIYSATRQDQDGNDVVQGTISRPNKSTPIKTTGSGADIVGAARNRLWGDDRIMDFYNSWSNGYIYTTTQ